jgi:hypothetical protein
MTTSIYEYQPIIAPTQHYSRKSAKYQQPVTSSALVERVALATIKEIATTFAFTAITCLFVSTPAGATFFIGFAVVMLSFNVAMRCAHAHCIYRLSRMNKNEISSMEGRHFQILEKASALFCGYNFATFDDMTRGTLVHEAGHALAFKALWKDAKPKITIYPAGGSTSAFYQGLTKIGNFFGRENSRLIISGAGSGLALSSSLVSIFVAHKIQKSHPNASCVLNFSAAMSIFNHCLYALTAFLPCHQSLSHDFVALAKGGIHPLAAIAVMVALPILLKLTLCLSDFAVQRWSARNRYRIAY